MEILNDETDVNKIRLDNDRTLKALMETVLANDKSRFPLMSSELLVEFSIRCGKFDELSNYIEYNIERMRLLKKFMSDFQQMEASFCWGGTDYGFGSGTWTNEKFGEPSDRIMPKIADSLIEIHNTYIKYHPNWNQTKLVRNESDKYFGMKYETTVGNEDRKVMFNKPLDVLYMFFYKKTLKEF